MSHHHQQVRRLRDQMDHAMREQELGGLERRRQRLAQRLLDHARPGKADVRAGLGDPARWNTARRG